MATASKRRTLPTGAPQDHQRQVDHGAILALPGRWGNGRRKRSCCEPAWLLMTTRRDLRQGNVRWAVRASWSKRRMVWLKTKHPLSPAVRREREIDWSKR
jgi:hypothetical protein